jgi:lysophospholipase L1-like esterase
MVVCLGSSTTVAQGTYDWIAELRRRPGNARLRFLNFGVGGDVAYNALQCVPQVTEVRPDRVIVIIGANDILASTFRNVARFYRRWKHLPEAPSAARFQRDLAAIVRRLKAETSARIAVASLAQIGEAPFSEHPVQAQLNAEFALYRGVIAGVAQEEGVTYIPFFERFHEAIVASPGRPFTKFRFLRFYRDYLFREGVLGLTFDQIAEINGWKFHIDGIHLNTRGGMILVQVIQEYLDGE